MNRLLIAILIVISIVAWLLVYLLPSAAVILLSDQHLNQVWRVIHRQVLP